MIKASSFDQISNVLIEKLCPEFGASEVYLFDFSSDLSIIRVLGDGPVAKQLRQDLDGVREWLRKHWIDSPEVSSLMAFGDRGEGLTLVPEVEAWLAETGHSDVLGGTLLRGPYRSACFSTVKRGGRFSADERERIETAILVSSSVMARLTNDNYERRVLERLMCTRNQVTNAVFVVRDGHVVPYNPGAVGYADAYWEKDDVEYLLSPQSAMLLRSAVMKGWSSPVDALWVTLDLDIGGGPLPVSAIVRADGGILLLFSPPPRQSIATTVPMLTRRQCDIMDWIAEGKTSAEVAIILDISPRTVEKHLEAIFQRFGVENRVAAVRSYLEAKGELNPGPVPG